MKIKIYNKKAEAVGEYDLSDKVFGVQANPGLIHEVVVAQNANKRQVLAHTKDRSEVSGGGRKPWKQKGTGRARAGSRTSPLWRGGGITFGPLKTRNFSKLINKKANKKALLATLSDKVASGSVVVLDKFEVKEYKTKQFNEIIKNLEKIFKNQSPKRSILILNKENEDFVKKSGRNLTGLEIVNLENINILDLLKYQNLILTQDGVKQLEKNYKN